jgi:excisionase family DNA binding protein
MARQQGSQPSGGLYDDDQAAQYLNTSKRHLERRRAERQLPFVRVGRKIRYKKSDLDAYIEAHRVGALS